MSVEISEPSQSVSVCRENEDNADNATLAMARWLLDFEIPLKPGNLRLEPLIRPQL